MTIKNVWVTPWSDRGELVSLTLESANPEVEHTRLTTQELLAPQKPTARCPLRHTLVLRLLSADDLRKIRDTIDRYLEAE